VSRLGRGARTAGLVALGLAVAAVASAAVVFVRPDLPRATLIAKYADAQSRFVALPDGTVAHVEIEGPAGQPTVVLLHGAMSSIQSWAGWRPALSARYRVVSIDLPGNGLTGETAARDYSRPGMVAFVRAVLGALGVNREAVIGHSMGGGVAAEYAERYPNEVWALVLIDAAGVSVAGANETESRRLAQNPVTRAILPWILPRAMLAKGLRKTFGDPSKVTDAMVDRIAEIERFPGDRAGLIGHYLAKSDDAALQAGLPSLRLPVLIEWGGLDTVQPLAAARTYDQQIRGARLIVYPGVGHDVIEEAASSSERDAEAFLSSVPKERPE
jgi:pimeloyl-ACP methyl ester carboxylesterase